MCTVLRSAKLRLPGHLLLVAFFALASAAQVNVITQHNDMSRTGQNLAEKILTPANVNATQFGKKFSQTVDGYVYAQPLYLSSVSIPNKGTHNVVYVVTEHDSVYAFDADSNTGANAKPLWQVSFIDPAHGITSVSSSDVACGDLVPEIGITGTPTIDPKAKTIYLIAKTKEKGSFVQRLHALDATTGAERPSSPVVIQATVPGTGDGGTTVSFNALTEGQRPGLLLMNGTVYIAWASHCDNGTYHGWLLGYNAATLKQVAVHNATPNGERGGYWASGAGVAGDPGMSSVFIPTGNGTFDADQSGSDYGDSILRVQRSGAKLTVSDYFTPYNQGSLNDGDTDLGSGGVLILPTQPKGAPHQKLLLQAGKEGSIYLVDRTKMGHFNSSNNSQIVEFLPFAVGGIWSMPAWWNNRVYFGGVSDALKVFAFDPAGGMLASSASSQSATIFGYPGTTPSISANGTKNAIVWALQTDAYASGGASILRAYDALDLSKELYNSSQKGSRDKLTQPAKFAVPTIANGKVYVGTRKELTVFGLLQ
jgi:hypothetical protein